MDKVKTAKLTVERLKTLYPEAVCSLEHGNSPFRLLVMGRLSAQCTDARVNIVSRELFSRYPEPSDLALADPSEVERIIFSIGLYRTKARDIIGIAKAVQERYGGKVPDTMEELLTLPGVGRKVANLVLGDVYGKPAIVADTHCIRISGRLGLSGCAEKKAPPERVERELSAIVEPSEQSDLCHRFVLFGRDVCKAKNPLCSECPLSDFCPSSGIDLTNNI